eukprot:CAMPEP_0202073396 /NCGR_PEP_ID=MMETSP0964-20121228/3006_1 /ASSEMBLY_ACC=CAM_ASM_000500 /TAXON_ID=4773 /ORGANISM="Schizochytrium aggregatum, Strain ATCC28209" /LENGTH=103 /DNA_ID=CAMNT_0048640487 /DNA_START=556 /DNA_END=867 /DNA_ORIENTATION=-
MSGFRERHRPLLELQMAFQTRGGIHAVGGLTAGKADGPHRRLPRAAFTGKPELGSRRQDYRWAFGACEARPQRKPTLSSGCRIVADKRPASCHLACSKERRES